MNAGRPVDWVAQARECQPLILAVMRAYPALTVGQAEVRAGQVLEDMTLGRIRTVQTHITVQCRIESADAAIAAILAVDPDAAVEERREERRSPRLAADGSLVS